MNDLQWEPIADAPKDGTFVDLWMIGDGSPNGYRSPDCWFSRGMWRQNFGNEMLGPENRVGDFPTHFMRIPAGPAIAP